VSENSVYLAGPIQHADNHGTNWREEIQEVYPDRFDWLDPLSKYDPTDPKVDFYFDEDDRDDLYELKTQTADDGSNKYVTPTDIVEGDKLVIDEADAILVGWSVEQDSRVTDSKTSDMKVCPECGEEKKLLAKHIQMSGCSWPKIPEPDVEAIAGMVLGDGSINNRDGLPRLDISMISGKFLEHLYDRFGVLSAGLKVKKTASAQAVSHRESGFNPGAEASEYSDVYRYWTIGHPVFEEFASWYGPNGKEIPDVFKLTPESARYWYVSDGGLNWNKKASRAYVQISSVVGASDERLEELFDEVGFSPNVGNGAVQFSVEESEKFLDWIGDPLPNFEYKWEYKSFKQYERAKPLTKVSSAGTPMEVMYQYMLNELHPHREHVPIVVWWIDGEYSNSHLSPWMEYHADRIEFDREDALNTLEFTLESDVIVE